MPLAAADFSRALVSNSAATSFASKIPTLVEPTGAGVISLPSAGGPKFVVLVPFGTDAANEAFDMKVVGWSYSSDGVWIPFTLLTVAVVLGSAAVSGLTNHFLADTITYTAGDDEAKIISPANDTVAHVLLHTRGFKKLEYDFDLGTAAAANCYYRPMDQD